MDGAAPEPRMPRRASVVVGLVGVSLSRRPAHASALKSCAWVRPDLSAHAGACEWCVGTGDTARGRSKQPRREGTARPNAIVARLGRSVAKKSSK